jgi:hypothetical protein
MGEDPHSSKSISQEWVEVPKRHQELPETLGRRKDGETDIKQEKVTVKEISSRYYRKDQR